MENLSIATEKAKVILLDLEKHWTDEPDPHVFAHAKVLANYLPDKTTQGDFIHRYSLCLFIYFAETKCIDTQSDAASNLWVTMQELIPQTAKIAFGENFCQAVEREIDTMEALTQRIKEILSKS